MPSRFDISELCILGCSAAFLRRCRRDQTMKAFIGRFMWLDDIGTVDCGVSCCQESKTKGDGPPSIIKINIDVEATPNKEIKQFGEFVEAISKY